MQKYNILLACLLTGLLGACYEKPSFPLAPQITFKEITAIPQRDSTTGFYLGDSVIIAVDFTDGNGDIGLSQADTLPPYQLYLDEDSTQINRFYFNYFCDVERRESGSYAPFALPNGTTLNGRISPITDSPNPVEGTIIYKTFIPAFSNDLQYTLNPYDTLRFRISIADRALNESNVIFTDSIVVYQTP
ncbi:MULTISPECIES: hypothetical protein [Thermonema]|uniref:hypothetical protein n=1 Tax=Thermonema TaxID=28194 RepID=UPI00056F6C47|nr:MULTISPECIES: hypothetical protein [Thermonema]